MRNQLQSYLIQVIRKQCSDCYDLTPSFLRPGMFLCHGNPTKTTYRSTLVNPFPTTTAARLVGIIQSWVSSNPSFILDDLLVRVPHTHLTTVPPHISLQFPHTSQWRRNHGGSGGWSPRRILVVKLCSIIPPPPHTQLRGVVVHVLKVCVYWSTVLEVCRVHSIMHQQKKEIAEEFVCVNTRRIN